MASRPFTLTPLTVRPPQITATPTSNPSLLRRFSRWIQSFIPSSRACKLIAIFLLLITQIVTGIAVVSLAISNTANSPIIRRCGEENEEPASLLEDITTSLTAGEKTCYRVSRAVRSALMIGYLVLFIANFGLMVWVWRTKIDEGNWRRRSWGARSSISGWGRTIGARRSVS